MLWVVVITTGAGTGIGAVVWLGAVLALVLLLQGMDTRCRRATELPSRCWEVA